MVQHRRFVDRAGIIIQAAGNGQIYRKMVLRDPERGQILHHSLQLVQALVEQLVPPPVLLQCGQHLLAAAVDIHKPQDLQSLLLRDVQLLLQDAVDLFGTDLVQLIHSAHDFCGFLRKPQHGIKAIQHLPVVDTDHKAP